MTEFETPAGRVGRDSFAGAGPPICLRRWASASEAVSAAVVRSKRRANRLYAAESVTRI